MILDTNKILKISEMFGFTRITSDGEWQYPIKGNLIKEKSDTCLYIFTY